jgi:mannosyltransferase OCH1-like enzyme
MNPEFDYYLYNVQDMSSYVHAHYPNMIEAYEKINSGAVRADFWRYMLIFDLGGVYLDFDVDARKPLSSIIDVKDTYVACGMIESAISQWAILSRPRHPVIKLALQYSYENILKAELEVSMWLPPPYSNVPFKCSTAILGTFTGTRNFVF